MLDYKIPETMTVNRRNLKGLALSGVSGIASSLAANRSPEWKEFHKEFIEAASKGEVLLPVGTVDEFSSSYNPKDYYKPKV